MSSASSHACLPMQYQVGGSLQSQAPSYITRAADKTLYEALLRGEFCYVLNSRQMGKSSLLVHTRARLDQVGFRCTTLDLTSIGGDNITPLQWYKGIVKDLWRSFKLMHQVPINDWWKNESDVSLLQQLNYFINDVLLKQFPGDEIVIFIDEVDSVLGLPFSADEFFALIRFCYNQRATNPEYNRIRFAIFGVASPSDLIRDRSRTPFNLGTAIELQGFTEQEAMPLAEGLDVQGGDRTAILQSILQWTGGQPFLTQKLCKLAIDAGENGQIIAMPGNESYWVEQLVQSAIVREWESQDEPEHLRTIRNRLLSNPDTVGRLLAVYQQVLTGQAVASNDSREQIELQLSGLVVKRNGHLQVRGRIYEQVFDQAWVEKQLSKLRPYAQALQAWKVSEQTDGSRLLRGNALKDAQAWSMGKRLSDEDYKFLAASVEGERQANQRAAEAEKVLMQLEQEQQASRLQRRLIGAVSAAFLVAVGFGALTFWQYRQSKIGEIRAIATAAEGHFDSHYQLEALQEIVTAQSKLEQLAWPPDDLSDQVRETLQKTLDGSHAMTQIDFDTEVNSLAIHPDGNLVAIVTSGGKLSFWHPNGAQAKMASELSGRTQVNQALFSPDGQQLVIALQDNLIELWSLTGKKLSSFQQPENFNRWAKQPLHFNRWGFSADHQSLWVRSNKKMQRLALDSGEVTDLPTEDGIGSSYVSADGSLIAGALLRPPPVSGQPMAKAPQAGLSPGRRLGFSHRSPLTASNGPMSDRPMSNGPMSNGPMADSRDRGEMPETRIITPLDSKAPLQLWDGAGNPVNAFETVGGPIFALAVSPQNDLVATAHLDGKIRITQPDGELLQELLGLRVKIKRLAFSPDGQLLAAGDVDGGIHLWNVGGSLIKSYLGHRARLNDLQFSPDGRWLASISQDNSLRFWNTEHPLQDILAGHTDVITQLAYSADGEELYSLGLDQRMQVWQRNREGDFLNRPARSHRLKVSFFGSFSRDRTTLAQIFPFGKILVGEREGSVDKQLESRGGTDAIALSPSGDRLAFPMDGNLVIWQKSTGAKWFEETPMKFEMPAQGITALAWNAQGKSLLLGDRWGGLAQLSDVSAKQPEPFGDGPFHAAAVTDVKTSADGRWIASASQDTTIKVWHRDGTLVQTLEGHSAGVRAIAFNFDGSQLASVSADGTLKLWKVGGLSRQASPLLRTFNLHQGEINSVTFSPDGSEIATAGSDRRVIVWKIQEILALDELEYTCGQVRDYLRHSPQVEKETRSLCGS